MRLFAFSLLLFAACDKGEPGPTDSGASAADGGDGGDGSGGDGGDGSGGDGGDGSGGDGGDSSGGDSSGGDGSGGDTAEPAVDPFCPPLPAPTGAVISVTEADAPNLRAIIEGLSEGDTVSFAPGTYVVDGDIQLTTPGVTLRSATGDRESVAIDAMYSGASVLQISASDVTIADLTIKRGHYHGVHVRPASGATESFSGARIYNVHILNATEQALKINQEGEAYADAGLLACSRLELDDAGRGHVHDCYTGGVDAHRTRGWVVRDNEVHGFWCEEGLSEHGIHFWRGNAETTIERNRVTDCARGIGLGLTDTSDGAERVYDDLGGCPEGAYIDDYYGLIRNNTVWVSDEDIFASDAGFDTGVSLGSACGARVYHNTVWSSQAPFSSIEWRYDGTTATIANNLMSHDLMDRGVTSADLEGNIEGADDPHWVDAAGGDLHLASGSPAIDAGASLAAGEADEDLEGDARGGAPDVGADELK